MISEILRERGDEITPGYTTGPFENGQVLKLFSKGISTDYIYSGSVEFIFNGGEMKRISFPILSRAQLSINQIDIGISLE